MAQLITRMVTSLIVLHHIPFNTELQFSKPAHLLQPKPTTSLWRKSRDIWGEIVKNKSLRGHEVAVNIHIVLTGFYWALSCLYY
ncbi:hypothetical protein V1519DRAFT_450203 [Lipomyces tetrasporus]